MVHLLLLAVALPSAHAGARAISPPVDGNCQVPAWSRNGARLAYEVNFHDRKRIDLYVYTPGAGAPRQVRPVVRGGSALTEGFGKAPEAVAHEASWGPAFVDRFVYSASNASRDYDLYIDQAGAIAAAPGADGTPAWSPDGRWIAFTSARTGQGDLYLVDAHQIDAAPRQLTVADDSSELYAAWSPAGDRLAYVAHAKDGDRLWVIDDLSSPTPRQLTDGAHTQTRPSFSPDGAHVAFYSNQEQLDRWDLYVVAATGGSARKLAEGVVMNARGPAWSPDGSYLVAVLDDDDAFDPVWRVPLAEGEASSKVPTGTVGNGDLDVGLGTDGATWLAVAAQGRESDEVRSFKRIFVMQLSD